MKRHKSSGKKIVLGLLLSVIVLGLAISIFYFYHQRISVSMSWNGAYVGQTSVFTAAISGLTSNKVVWGNRTMISNTGSPVPTWTVNSDYSTSTLNCTFTAIGNYYVVEQVTIDGKPYQTQISLGTQNPPSS